MRFIIHRGAQQVGGSCVEINCEQSTIILDTGLPLDYSFGDDLSPNLPQPLFTDLNSGIKKLDGVFLSHAHLDHYGIAGLLPQGVPVYCGKASAKLMKISGEMFSGRIPLPDLLTFLAKDKVKIGPFTVTPYLMDHSAFDSYGFLISAGGKNIFYSGDFRGHGRKSKIFDRFINNPPNDVDVLLMEGTLVGRKSSEPTMSESGLEEKFVEVIRTTRGIVLVTTASQNIDRLVTLFRAAKRTNRMFIIDFYTAEILDQLKEHGRLPQASWPRIRVCYPQPLAKRFEELGLSEILARHRKNGIRWTGINDIEVKAVMLIRPGFLRDIKRFLSLEGSSWVYSMWRGYFERSKPLRDLREYLEEKQVRIEYLHTSGHASLSDLKKMVDALNPETIVPIHSFHPEEYKNHFPYVRQLEDGEVFEIT
ncbi:MBL fold metallo-hydrolase [Thermodesulfobacteriota bacterium]